MGSRRDKDGGLREESQGSPSVMVLGGLWFALCSTLVWTRFENINVFFSFVTAIACRAICGALIRNQGLASSLVGCVYSLLHSVLTLATWVAHSAWVEDALLVSSTGYVCMTLFDQMMSGLMRDRVDEIMIKDNAVMLSLLTAQYHRELRLPYMSLISLTFLHHLWFHALDAYIEIFERPSSSPTKLPRSHLALSAKRLPYAAASRAVLVLFQGIPRSIALLSLLRDSWGIPGFLAKFDTVEIVGSALGVMLLNVLAVSALEANSYLSLDSHGRQRKGALSKKRRLWTIAGKTYDLSSFVPKHPGGEASILLGQGRDATALFLSYHPFSKRHLRVLQRFEVKEISGDSHVRSTTPPGVGGGTTRGTPRRDSADIAGAVPERDDFYDVLCKRVASVLRERSVDASKASISRWAYYVAVMGVTWWSYNGYISGSPARLIVFATASWLMGAMGHDASHFAISHEPWVNNICMVGIALLCSPALWLNQHTYAHHSHTNEYDRDPDMHHFPFLRNHTRTPPHRRYKHQVYRLYVWVWYLFISFGECIWLPIRSMVTGTLYSLMHFPGEGLGWKGWAVTLAHWSWFFLFIIAPPFRHLSALRACATVVAYLALTGIYFGVFSQINHLNAESVVSDDGKKGQPSLAGSSPPAPSPASPQTSCKKGREQDRDMKSGEWARNQVIASNNFCLESPLWTWIANGLNYQIEHHLFPGINHQYLHLVAPVVAETCREYGVPYKSFDSMSSIAGATLAYYKELATKS